MMEASDLFIPQHTPRADLLDGHILSRLFRRLDVAFPEFGFKRVRGGWKATQPQDLSIEPPRRDGFVCSQLQSRFVHWTAFVLGHNKPPHGETLRYALTQLCQLADCDPAPVARLNTVGLGMLQYIVTQRSVSEEFYQRCRGELEEKPNGDRAREHLAWLDGRTDAWRHLEVGLVPCLEPLCDALLDLGYTEDELISQDMFTRTQIEGMLVYPKRDVAGRITAFRFAKWTPRRRFQNTNLPPRNPASHQVIEGLQSALRNDSNRDLVIIDSRAELFLFREAGILNVASANLGRIRTKDWKHILRERPGSITLAFSSSEAVLRSLQRLDECEGHPPETFVLAHGDFNRYIARQPDFCPNTLCYSPGALIAKHGRESWRRTIPYRWPASVWRCCVAIGGIRPDWSREAKLERLLAVRFDYAQIQASNPVEASIWRSHVVSRAMAATDWEKEDAFQILNGTRPSRPVDSIRIHVRLQCATCLHTWTMRIHEFLECFLLRRLSPSRREPNTYEARVDELFCPQCENERLLRVRREQHSTSTPSEPSSSATKMADTLAYLRSIGVNVRTDKIGQTLVMPFGSRSKGSTTTTPSTEMKEHSLMKQQSKPKPSKPSSSGTTRADIRAYLEEIGVEIVEDRVGQTLVMPFGSRSSGSTTTTPSAESDPERNDPHLR